MNPDGYKLNHLDAGYDHAPHQNSSVIHKVQFPLKKLINLYNTLFFYIFSASLFIHICIEKKLEPTCFVSKTRFKNKKYI